MFLHIFAAAAPAHDIRTYLLCVLFDIYVYILYIYMFSPQGSKHGVALSLQLMDVSLRVEEVREYAIHKAVGLLLDISLIKVSQVKSSQSARKSVCLKVSQVKSS